MVKVGRVIVKGKTSCKEVNKYVVKLLVKCSKEVNKYVIRS